ncbi:protein kinase domain-containing protein [Coleofasciculus sp. LEGE 07081]|uniref:protein kinase domain-containing protein n=1 Tax=unclassified Coleofasciculus TaxID=2692782 RepID=UPI0018807001|nr:ankyrin repeat domain-containing protein [Coleofasciculus sp. LEGE 07081]MBE9147646.1 ankyrin repeat domain-containing protein [Coleofasciculus sp. LEGE 07092]
MELLHAPGDSIAQRYCILSTLGQGGSGITYQAKDTQTRQQVALKALSLHRLTDWKMLELFEREALVLAKLNHPGIPKYLDYFHTDTSQDRSFYIVQQLAEGQSLDVLVNKGWRTNERQVRQIAIQILEILVYLQALKPPVIHRDIKPQNIILHTSPHQGGAKGGQVFLVDFGAVQDTYHSTFMRGSTMVGTYGYMAPEQFRGQAVPATDLYGLGATLLFLLTHRSPADLPTDRLKIDFRSRVQISEYFADWLEKILEPDVKDRFSSAQEALAALRSKRRINTESSSSTPWKAIAGVGIATVVAVSILNQYKYPILSAMGFTPRALYEGIMGGDIETVRYYLDRGVNVNAREYQDHTPLHWAVSNNKPNIAELLIDRGADIQARYDEDGHTVLHIAVQHDTKDMAELLMNRGADIHTKDNFGNNCLHLALMKSDVSHYYGMVLTEKTPSIEIVELLIERGVDIHAKNNRGETPLYFARSQSQEAAELLQRYGATE